MLTVLNHSLIKHKLSIMREADTSTYIFKQNLDEIAKLMAYEVTREVPIRERVIRTPICETIGYEMAEIPGIADAINKYRRELGLKDVEWMGPDWSEAGMQKVVQEFNSKDEETKQMIRESFPECFNNGEIDPVKYSWKRKCSRVCNSMEYCIVNNTISHGNDYDGVQSNCNGQRSGYNLERWVFEFSYSAGHWNKLMSKSAGYVYAVMSPPNDEGSCKICIYIF